MKAQKMTKFGFECPQCNEIHTPDEALTKADAWEVDPGDLKDNRYLMDEPQKTEIYRYDEDGADECIGEDEPEYQEAWQCGECEQVYLDKDEAKECCKA